MSEKAGNEDMAGVGNGDVVKRFREGTDEDHFPEACHRFGRLTMLGQPVVEGSVEIGAGATGQGQHSASDFPPPATIEVFQL